ncbi:MAG: DUF5711 family protein [Lachnospiraceae bacterium]|nr:DUF5711 family protein [Lachnospiraceae bacterium]
MNKENIRQFFGNIKDKVSILKLGEDSDWEDEMQNEDWQEPFDSEDEEELPEGDLKAKIFQYRQNKYYRNAVIVFLAAVVLGGFIIYNKIVTYDTYVIAASYENTVAAGTQYVMADKDILKYNADGVSCVSRNNDVRWSITYSMQAPVADICDTTMVIAEQQGTQIYIVEGEEGQIGSFETTAPILKARVARQGVVAAVLQEDDVTWVNLYQTDGTLIASDKTTLMESGYPLDIAISPDGQRLMVSYLQVTGGVLSDTVVFYHFGTAGQKKENHIVSSETFEGTAVPDVYFVDNSHSVAVTDQGFAVFQGKDEPKKTATVEFEDEIVSCFHENETIGFVFNSEDTESRYRMELYNLRGKRKMKTELDRTFSRIKMENGQILMYNDKNCTVYTSSGHEKFSANYEKEVSGFFYFSEFRKYLVITRDSFDRIRIGAGG